MESFHKWKCILSERKRKWFKLHTTMEHSNFNDPVSVGERFFLVSDKKFVVPFVSPEVRLFYYIF